MTTKKSPLEKPRPPYGSSKKELQGWIILKRTERAATNYKGAMPKSENGSKK